VCAFGNNRCSSESLTFNIHKSLFNMMIRTLRSNHLLEGTHQHLQAYITSTKEKNVFSRVCRFADNTVKYSSSREADSYSANQEVPRIFGTLNFVTLYTAARYSSIS
jgi:hypothetical protein